MRAFLLLILLLPVICHAWWWNRPPPPPPPPEPEPVVRSTREAEAADAEGSCPPNTQAFLGTFNFTIAGNQYDAHFVLVMKKANFSDFATGEDCPSGFIPAVYPAGVDPAIFWQRAPLPVAAQRCWLSSFRIPEPSRHFGHDSPDFQERKQERQQFRWLIGAGTTAPIYEGIWNPKEPSIIAVYRVVAIWSDGLRSLAPNETLPQCCMRAAASHGAGKIEVTTSSTTPPSEHPIQNPRILVMTSPPSTPRPAIWHPVPHEHGGSSHAGVFVVFVLILGITGAGVWKGRDRIKRIYSLLP